MIRLPLQVSMLFHNKYRDFKIFFDAIAGKYTLSSDKKEPYITSKKFVEKNKDLNFHYD